MENDLTMVELRKLANIIMEILNGQPRNNPKLTNHELLSIVKDRTRANTFQLIDVIDAVSFLELQHAVVVDRSMGTAPPDFDFVKISRLGRSNFQINRDWPMTKESKDDKPSQEIRIERVVGDIQISQSGNNIKIMSTTSFHELKDKIMADSMFSDEGKQAIIEQVAILEEEEKSEKPNKGRAQRAYDWIEAKAPPFVKEIVINLLANLIAQGIINVV